MLKSRTWLSWNGKRVNGESCKHVKKKQEPREQQHDQEPEREHQEEQQRKSGKNSESIQLASQTFAWSFAGALRAPAQRFELGFSSSFAGALRAPAQRFGVGSLQARDEHLKRGANSTKVEATGQSRPITLHIVPLVSRKRLPTESESEAGGRHK